MMEASITRSRRIPRTLQHKNTTQKLKMSISLSQGILLTLTQQLTRPISRSQGILLTLTQQLTRPISRSQGILLTLTQQLTRPISRSQGILLTLTQQLTRPISLSQGILLTLTQQLTRPISRSQTTTGPFQQVTKRSCYSKYLLTKYCFYIITPLEYLVAKAIRDWLNQHRVINHGMKVCRKIVNKVTYNVHKGADNILVHLSNIYSQKLIYKRKKVQSSGNLTLNIFNKFPNNEYIIARCY